ncbi:Flp family type IVb pilin [Pigmentiphaga aceris]|uniref:Flp family type IVb pilin n=1 Tax=Pigmentiphaga aceris TaxID=1940612 RepID=A0A5C0ATK4_9BURK|nr:Flp family type IVb pilin [Pigmentiphaga aceris]QEI05638.1 Flp family type IVb pilin [Pigmentiphaga aceris]
MKNEIAQFLREEDGATALEYGLIAGLIAVAVIAVIGTFTGALQGLFNRLATRIGAVG